MCAHAAWGLCTRCNGGVHLPCGTVPFPTDFISISFQCRDCRGPDDDLVPKKFKSTGSTKARVLCSFCFRCTPRKPKITSDLSQRHLHLCLDLRIHSAFYMVFIFVFDFVVSALVMFSCTLHYPRPPFFSHRTACAATWCATSPTRRGGCGDRTRASCSGCARRAAPASTRPSAVRTVSSSIDRVRVRMRV